MISITLEDSLSVWTLIFVYLTISILVDLFEKKSSEEKKNDESKTANIYLIKDSPRWLLIKNKLEVLMKNPVPVTNSKLYVEKIIKKRDLESM